MSNTTTSKLTITTIAILGIALVFTVLFNSNTRTQLDSTIRDQRRMIDSLEMTLVKLSSDYAREHALSRDLRGKIAKCKDDLKNCQREYRK